MEVELAFSGWSGILVLALYGALMLGVGVFAYLRNRGMRESLDEYYLGGRGLGVMVLFSPSLLPSTAAIPSSVIRRRRIAWAISTWFRCRFSS